MAAAIAATGVNAEINTVDHNTYQENFNTYIQQPDDVMAWFAGYRMRAFASKGVVGDITDVWAGPHRHERGLQERLDRPRRQAVLRAVLLLRVGRPLPQEPVRGEGLRASRRRGTSSSPCATQMEADGITPFSAANDGGWPQMGMFDMINMRTNGYDFHVVADGRQGELDRRPKVKQVFTNWERPPAYYQPDANGRTWQDAATALGNKETGMYLLGNFLTSNFDGDTQQDIIDDIDFFAFPEIDPAYGQDAIEAPIDGFMMAASPDQRGRCEGAARRARDQGGDRGLHRRRPVGRRRRSARADTSGYNALQQKAAELVGSGEVHRPVPRPRHRPRLRLQGRRQGDRRLPGRSEPDRRRSSPRSKSRSRPTPSSEVDRDPQFVTASRRLT